MPQNQPQIASLHLLFFSPSKSDIIRFVRHLIEQHQAYIWRDQITVSNKLAQLNTTKLSIGIHSILQAPCRNSPHSSPHRPHSPVALPPFHNPLLIGLPPLFTSTPNICSSLVYLPPASLCPSHPLHPRLTSPSAL